MRADQSLGHGDCAVHVLVIWYIVLYAAVQMLFIFIRNDLQDQNNILGVCAVSVLWILDITIMVIIVLSSPAA